MGCRCGTLEKRVNEKFSEEQIIVQEVCLPTLRYQRSQGCCQIQGNGALVLTPDVLWFNLLCPNKEIEMPLRNIRVVQVSFGFGRQQAWVGQPALFVDFVDVTSGIEDQVAIVVTDPEYWKRTIDETIQRQTKC
ncbi:hypothetical protein ACROYT_G015880 [Oculina patagonica]